MIRPDKLDCPHAMGLTRFHHSGQSHFVTFCCYHRPIRLLRCAQSLRAGSLVYHGRKPTNLRVSLGARAAQFQASRLRVRSHAGACSPPAQRANTGYVQRSNCPTQAKRRLEWATRCPLKIGSQNPHPNVAKSATLRMGHPRLAMRSIFGKSGTTISTFAVTRSLWKSCAIFIAIR
jgi:hypothetical protein